MPFPFPFPPPPGMPGMPPGMMAGMPPPSFLPPGAGLGGIGQVQAGQDPRRSLFCGNISPFVSEGLLFHIFATCGPVAACRIIKDKSGESAKYGFVDFCDHQTAAHALQVRIRHYPPCFLCSPLTLLLLVGFERSCCVWAGAGHQVGDGRDAWRRNGRDSARLREKGKIMFFFSQFFVCRVASNLCWKSES